MTRARTAAAAALGVVALVAVFTARQLSTGEAHAAAADVAASKSDWPEAIAHSRAAAEARGDDDTALLAYGAMRAAALATRGPGSGWARRREQAEAGLARVAAARREPAGPRTTAESMLDALRADETPATPGVVALAATALAMVGGLARLAWLGEGAARGRVAQAVAALGVLGYVAVALTR